MSGAMLRRREDGSVELRVNGVFVMDDVETSSERALAGLVLARGARDILVGGLGLGFTARELLASPAVDSLIVAEIHPEIAEWMRAGVIDGAEVLADHRLELRIGDVRDVILDVQPSSLDAILLDVDNGPDHLVYDSNAALYHTDFLRACAQRLRPHGSLSLWSQADSTQLRRALEHYFSEVHAEEFPVRLQRRDESYWVITGSRRSGCEVPGARR